MRSNIVRGASSGLAVVALVLASHGLAFAGAPIQAPEIDGSMLSAGFGLLAAGVLIVRSRVQAK